ncbi:DUF721 domain-containing protein [Paracoccus aestuarii]|nr:DUF721 domain-containing protein [Paracoccus aestuarii]WCR00617.1 DUF721 domain-containing protein [Paracoccus aestuarii]
MAHPSDSPKTRSRRRSRGFQPAASLLADRVQKAAEGRGFAVARLLTHWPEIAGPQLSAVTRPVRISHARGGFGATLTLLTTGPMAPMVEMQLPQLRDRVNACYGYNAVQVRRDLVARPAGQTALLFVEQHPRDGIVFLVPAAARQDPGPKARAEGIARQFDDPGLAQAMARLALNVAARKT